MAISNNTTGPANVSPSDSAQPYENQVQDQDQEKQRQQQQQFVILAGPHKTASSTTQSTLVSLQKKNLLNPYVWPRKLNHTNKLYHSKQFAALARRPRKNSHYKYYTKEFEMIWSKGQSIVIAAELFGSASLSSSSSVVLDGLKEILPIRQTDKIEESVSVVLNFRSKRLSHLVSVWGQYNYFTEIKVSFTDWMCSMSCLLLEPKLNMNVVNTLGQADVYRQANYNVVIVDMDGVERDGLDVANIPVCEILGIVCVDGIPEGLGRVRKQGKGARKRRGGLANIGERKSQDINTILKRMDCSYEHLITDKNVRILHRSDMFSNCSIWLNESKINEKQACSLIQDVLGCGHNSTFHSSLIGIEDYKERSDRLTNQTNVSDAYSPIGIKNYIEPSDGLNSETNETVGYFSIGIEDNNERNYGRARQNNETNEYGPIGIEDSNDSNETVTNQAGYLTYPNAPKVDANDNAMLPNPWLIGLPLIISLLGICFMSKRLCKVFNRMLQSTTVR